MFLKKIAVGETASRQTAPVENGMEKGAGGRGEGGGTVDGPISDRKTEGRQRLEHGELSGRGL